jgi:hypothetical protein
MQPHAVTPEPSGPEAARLLGDAGKAERDPSAAQGDFRGADETPEAVADAEPLGHEGEGKPRDVIDVSWDRLDVGDAIMDLYGDDITDFDDLS